MEVHGLIPLGTADNIAAHFLKFPEPASEITPSHVSAVGSNISPRKNILIESRDWMPLRTIADNSHAASWQIGHQEEQAPLSVGR